MITYNDTDRPRIVAGGAIKKKWDPGGKSLEKNFRTMEIESHIRNYGNAGT